DLGRELSPRLLDQGTQRRHVGLQDARRIFFRKTLQRDQQEGLPRARRELGEAHVGRDIRVGGGLLPVDGNRIPQFGEKPVKRNPAPPRLVDNGRVAYARVQSC